MKNKTDLAVERREKKNRKKKQQRNLRREKRTHLFAWMSSHTTNSTQLASVCRCVRVRKWFSRCFCFFLKKINSIFFRVVRSFHFERLWCCEFSLLFYLNTERNRERRIKEKNTLQVFRLVGVQFVCECHVLHSIGSWSAKIFHSRPTFALDDTQVRLRYMLSALSMTSKFSFDRISRAKSPSTKPPHPIDALMHMKSIFKSISRCLEFE